MDTPQPSLPLQAHGNTLALCSGHVPKVHYYEGGGRDEEGQKAGLKVTSSAPVISRLNPGEPFQSPLLPAGQCHTEGKMDNRSRGCSLVTICRSGLIFPWMNSRTSDAPQSGNVVSFFILLNHCTLLEWINTVNKWTNRQILLGVFPSPGCRCPKTEGVVCDIGPYKLWT